METAVSLTATLISVSGAVVQLWMEGTHPDFGTHEPVRVERDLAPPQAD